MDKSFTVNLDTSQNQARRNWLSMIYFNILDNLKNDLNIQAV